MTKLIDLLDQLKYRRTFGFLDDFDWYASPGRWTSVLNNSGSIAAADAASGILVIQPSGSSPAENDESYVRTSHAIFAFAPDQPIVFEALLQFTEANVNAANVIVGLMNGVTSNPLSNNDGGPTSSYSGMIFYKTGGSTTWSCQSSVGGAQTNTAASVTAGGPSYQTLTGQFQPISSTQAEARFFIDGLLVANQLFTYGGASLMELFAGVKNGSGSMETLNVDYLAGYQLR